VTSPRDAEPGRAPTGPSLRIDALGKKCPLPIIMLAQRIGEVSIGNVVEVLADDPATKTDVPAWCGLKSHEFLGATDLAPTPGWSYHIRRSY
jgi:tRNA 2-thiouridine synthesizing protein A